MLVATEVQPGSNADGPLAVGDVLVSINGKPMSDFEALDALLDDNVGKSIEATVVRGGGSRKVTLAVQDLHAITPADYLEIGDGVLHTLSWQMARHMNVPISGVYVANPGYMLGVAGIPRGAVLTELDGKPLRTSTTRWRSSRRWGRASARRSASSRWRTRARRSSRRSGSTAPGSPPGTRARRRDRHLALHADRRGPDAPPPKPGTTLFHAHRRQAGG